jgi:hypothetical protein
MSRSVLIPKGSITGKGYILTKDAAGSLIAIAPGATGTILSSDPSAASGLAWIAAPTGGGGGTGNMNYRGTWQPTTPYAVNDAYVAPSSAGANAGELFVVTTAHTSPSSFNAANATHISDLLANDVRYRGTWAATTSYKQNDIVFQAGSLWAANADFTSSGSFNASNWTQISSGGGMVNPMTTAGDLIVGGVAGAPVRVAKGPDGQVWTMVSGSPAWAAAAGSGGAAAGPRPIPFVAGASYVSVPSDGGDHYPGTVGQLSLSPWTAARSCTITSLGVRCRIGASAGALIRFAIYSDTGGLAATLVGMSSSVAADVANDTVITATVSIPVVAGTVYWAGLKYIGSYPTTPAMMQGSSSGGVTSWIPTDGSNPVIGASSVYDVSTGNPPATLTGLGAAGSQAFTVIMSAAA